MPTQTEIQMVEVQSSNIRAAGYDKETRVLRLRFHDGAALYDFENVPQRLYRGLMKAQSKGTFFKEQIKDKFNYTRIKV